MGHDKALVHPAACWEPPKGLPTAIRHLGEHFSTISYLTIQAADVCSWSVTGTSRTGYQVPKRAGSQRIAGRRAAQSAIPAGSTESEPSRGSHLDGPPSRDSLLPSLRRLVSKVCSSLAIPEEDLPFGSQGETDEWREYVAEHRNAKRDKRLERDTEVENEKDSEVEDDSCSEKGL
jgi:hypothetical protein